jgi:hypothetical protein
MIRFRLRFPESQIPVWAARYFYPKESEIVDGVAPMARDRGYLNLAEFLALCFWKSPRTRPRCEENREALVEAVTRTALSAEDEELKIRVLLLLSGVSWPTASVILHFCDRGRYPILDYRALWSLGVKKAPPYNYEFWARYRDFVRGLADRISLDMRTIDRALWQYSKEKQRGGGASLKNSKSGPQVRP